MTTTAITTPILAAATTTASTAIKATTTATSTLIHSTLLAIANNTLKNCNNYNSDNNNNNNNNNVNTYHNNYDKGEGNESILSNVAVAMLPIVLNTCNETISNMTRNTNYNRSSNNNQIIDDNEDDEVIRTFEDVSNIITFYYVPILVCTGSIGNILSVVVFFKTKLRKLSSSYYLAALAVSDTCFLFGLFVQWLNYVEINIYNRDYFCQFFTFFSNLANFCSVWFVVAFTVERFIAVMYPLRRQTMCTVRRAKIVLIGLIGLGCVHCGPFWIASTPVYVASLGTTICDIKSEYKEYITLLNYWDTIVVYAVPFTTIVVLNTITGCTVWKLATIRRTLTMQRRLNRQTHLSNDSSCGNINATTTAFSTMSTYRMSLARRQKAATCKEHQRQHQQLDECCTNAGNGAGTCGSGSGCVGSGCGGSGICGGSLKADYHFGQGAARHTTTNREKNFCGNSMEAESASTLNATKSTKRKIANSSQLKVTRMLLIVSTVFVCFNLPSCVLRMITFVETQTSTNEKTTIVLQYIFQLLFITNFGINFVLYCVSGQNFRKAVVNMFRSISTTHREGTTQITEYCRNSGISGGTTATRRRLMSQQRWNEMYELQALK